MAITPQKPELNKAMVAQHELGFDLLWDENHEVGQKFGLTFDMPEDLVEVYRGFGVDLPANHGADGWRLPMPGRFVIDAGGIVRSVDVDPDYRFRPEPQATLDIVAAL